MPPPLSSQNAIRESVANLEVRQHMLEDGTIVDIPAAALYSPPPKPIEFLYLKHYYQTPSGIKQELKEAGSAEAQIDILAAELEGMRHLLTGYVHTWEKYMEKFDGEHEAVREDMKGIVESYNGLRPIVKAVVEQATFIGAAFGMLERKARSLHTHSMTRPPPKIVHTDGRPAGCKNPPMTAEEARQGQALYEAHKMNADNSSWVTNAQNAFKQRELLADIITPPSRPQSDADGAPAPAPAADEKEKTHADKEKGKGKGKAKEAPAPAQDTAPIDPRVEVKIEKLAEGLEAMRGAFQRVHAKTEQDLVHLRVLSQKEQTATKEVWAVHDNADHYSHVAGTLNKMNLPRIQAFDRWAAKCLEDQAAAEAAKSAAASSAASGAPGPAPSTVPSASKSSTADNEVYSVSLNLKYEKDLDKLTREEAIEMLKALPVRVLFTPFGTTEDGGATAVNGTIPQGTRQGAGAPKVANGSASGAGQPPAAKKSKAGAESRKRGRTSEDASEKHVDSRVAAGGPPVKKMRVNGTQ